MYIVHIINIYVNISTVDYNMFMKNVSTKKQNTYLTKIH